MKLIDRINAIIDYKECGNIRSAINILGNEFSIAAKNRDIKYAEYIIFITAVTIKKITYLSDNTPEKNLWLIRLKSFLGFLDAKQKALKQDIEKSRKNRLSQKDV